MRTRSQTRNHNRQQQAQPAVVEPFNLEEPFDNPPLVPMADNRTMAQLLQAPTEGYEDAIVIPEINANFELKHVVAKVSSNSSTPGISPDVAALTTEVSELKNMMKTMLIDKQKAQAPVPVKAVEQSCVTCGGAHSYRNYPAIDGNVYRDNIQEYVSQAAAANFNQGNTNSRPPMVANQIRPPGFPPIQNNQNRFNQNQGNNFNQNRGTNFNQNRGNNFYQGQVYQPPTSQPPVYQAHPYQAPAPQMQGVSKTDFENYVKANDAILRNMQNQGQGLQNQMTNLTEMLSKFINTNTASTSTSCSLPSNIVTNSKEDLKGITTQSGVAYQGPTIPTTSPKVVREGRDQQRTYAFLLITEARRCPTSGLSLCQSRINRLAGNAPVRVFACDGSLIGDCGLGIGVGNLTSTSLEELQWFNFFLYVGLTDILATLEGLGKGLLGEDIGEDKFNVKSNPRSVGEYWENIAGCR
ncbi:hypothetical protein Tco_1284835 [Tanacetum coccineum]